MRRLGTLLILLAVSCGTGAKGSRAPRKQLSPKDIITQSAGAIVRIEAGENTATGFIVDRAGLVVTNLHVVAGVNAVKIKLQGGDTFPVMAVAGYDTARDLALLRIASPKPLPALRLGDSSVVSAGDKVTVIGNPLGVFTYSVTDGLISQVRTVCTKEQAERNQRNQARAAQLVGKAQALIQCEAERRAAGAPAGKCAAYKLTPEEEEEIQNLLRCSDELTVLQFSAPISQGSSGGPLFNQFGEVVGMSTWIIPDGQNLNLAIPTNYVKPMVAKPRQISMDEFATQTRALVARASSPEDGVKIQRLVPDHAASIFKGCKPDQIGEMVDAIGQAIDVGAPLYNKGEIEACFRIYEGTAVKFEREPGCPGISAAFGDGLLRAKTLDTYKEKAWAMRDTFDGLLNAAKKWAQSQPSKPAAPKK